MRDVRSIPGSFREYPGVSKGFWEDSGAFQGRFRDGEGLRTHGCSMGFQEHFLGSLFFYNLFLSVNFNYANSSHGLARVFPGSSGDFLSIIECIMGFQAVSGVSRLLAV